MTHDRRPSEDSLSPEALELARREIAQAMHQLLAPQSGMEAIQDAARMLRAHAGGSARWQEVAATELTEERSPIAPVQRGGADALRVESAHALAVARFTANPAALSALEHALVLLHGEIRPDVAPEYRTHRERLLAVVRMRRAELLARPALFLDELSEQIERDREAMEAQLASLKAERGAVSDVKRKIGKQKDLDPAEREQKIAELDTAFRMLTEAIRPLRELLEKQAEPIVAQTAEEAWASGADAPAPVEPQIVSDPAVPEVSVQAAAELRATVARVTRSPEQAQLVRFANRVAELASKLEDEGLPFYLGVDIASERMEHPRFVDVAPVRGAAGWHRATLNPFTLEQIACASDDPEVLRLARKLCDLLDPKRLQTRTQQTILALTERIEALRTRSAAVAESRTAAPFPVVPQSETAQAELVPSAVAASVEK